MSDTPLTDSVTAGCHFGPFVEALADHARQMERQRNAARHALTQTLDVIGPLFLEACSLLDNAALRDTEPWQRALAELKAKAKQTLSSNAEAHGRDERSVP